MKLFIALILLPGALLAGSVALAAQPAFYNKNTIIKSINYADKTARVRIGQDMIRQFNLDSNAAPERTSAICQSLSQFAEDGQSTQAGKPITLITVESKSIGDSIYEQEIIGFVDIDYLRSTKESIQEIDPVYTYYCGTLGDNPRASTRMCLMTSREELYFVQFTSMQQYRLMKTSVSGGGSDRLILQSKKSDGKVELVVNATKVDDETFDAKVDFGKGPVSTLLKKQISPSISRRTAPANTTR